MKKNACRPAYICPPRLREGDRAALIATASPASEKQLAEAVRSLKELNLSPVVFPSCRAQKEYLSGDDRLRAHDLMLAFSDPGIRAIFCLRGGYGSARLLDLLDYNTIRQNPKIFAGFSDVTALHAAFAKHCGFITYHAPMPSYPYRKYDRHITLASLQSALFSESGSYELKKAESGAGKTDKKESCGNRTEGGSAPGIFGTETAVMNGRLLGGNLTVFASLLGTPYMPDTDGCILFLEDVGEKTYRIDRAFTSLRLAGKLKGCRGILLGTFSGCTPPRRSRRSCQAIIREIASSAGVPVLSGLPFGHSVPNLTLPMGALCTVTAVPDAERAGHPIQHSLRLQIRCSF